MLARTQCKSGNSIQAAAFFFLRFAVSSSINWLASHSLISPCGQSMMRGGEERRIEVPLLAGQLYGSPSNLREWTRNWDWRSHNWVPASTFLLSFLCMGSLIKTGPYKKKRIKRNVKELKEWAAQVVARAASGDSVSLNWPVRISGGTQVIGRCVHAPQFLRPVLSVSSHFLCLRPNLSQKYKRS